MKAILLSGFGGVENLKLTDIGKPKPAAGEVLIKVHSISLNPIDVKTRSGKSLAGRLKDMTPLILGWDISGTVDSVGEEVSRFREGDEVFGMINFPGHGKAYAEYVSAPEDHIALKPESVSHEEAAAASLAALTAIKALRLMNVKAGDRVLIHAAAGGVGHYAVQLAKYYGAWIAGTASEKNRELVQGLGADKFIDYRYERLAEAVSGIDAVLDTLGNDTIDASLEVMKEGGIIVSIPSGKNNEVSEKAAKKNMTGMTMLVDSSDRDIVTVAEYLREGIIRSHIFRVYSYQDIAEAHRQVESGSTAGKVIVTFV